MPLEEIHVTAALCTNSAFEAVLLTFCGSSQQFIWQARKPQMRPTIWVSGLLSQQETFLPRLPDRVRVCVSEKSSDGAMWITGLFSFFSSPNLDLSPHFAELAFRFSPYCILFRSNSCPHNYIFLLLAITAPFE